MPDRPEPTQEPLIIPESRLLEYLNLIFRTTHDYTVEIINGTYTTFDEIDVLYKQVGQPYPERLTQGPLGPGETLHFNLGPCFTMERYNVGFFVDPFLVAQVPPEGGYVTPDTKRDAEPCADSWEIFDNGVT